VNLTEKSLKEYYEEWIEKRNREEVRKALLGYSLMQKHGKEAYKRLEERREEYERKRT
jgi:hypothetical protein